MTNNHYMKKSLILLSLLSVLTGCATKPENIPPSYISHITYMQWTCGQLTEEQARLAHALAVASSAQRTARSNDIAGVILIGLPVSSLAGSNQAANIGRLKGELEALQKAALLNDCGLEPVEIIVIEPDDSKNSRSPGPAWRK